MNSANLFGKVKTIIRKKEKLNAPGLLIKFINAHEHVNTIKFRYEPSPPLVLYPLTLKTQQHMPEWFMKLTYILERYLNVAIIRDKRLIGNKIEPIYSLTIVGEEAMASLTTHYIDLIYTSISRLVADRRGNLARKAKINRRRKRDGESTIPMGDAREGASQLKGTIILSIIGTLENLLDDCQKNYPVSSRNAAIRNDYVDTQLRLKYSNKWKSGLSTRFG